MREKEPQFTPEQPEESEKEEGKKERVWQDNPYWQEKGPAKEQFEVLFGERKIDVHNFTDIPLTGRQLEELERVVAEFSQIENGAVFDKVKSILVDSEQPIDPDTDKEMNGYGIENNDTAIKLYPAALKRVSHRIKGVSNFGGTLIHELTHCLFGHCLPNLDEEWKNRFGWKISIEKLNKFHRYRESSPETKPRDWKFCRFWEINDSQKCVNDYAQLGPEDDIAESMVAVLRNPEILDPERLKFIQEKFLGNIIKKASFDIKIQKKETEK